MKKVNPKIVEKYLNMPYSFVINQVNDESGKYFVARVLELEGLIGTGDTYDEAYTDVKEAMGSYVETKIANRIELSLPMDSTDYSEKFMGMG